MMNIKTCSNYFLAWLCESDLEVVSRFNSHMRMAGFALGGVFFIVFFAHVVIWVDASVHYYGWKACLFGLTVALYIVIGYRLLSFHLRDVGLNWRNLLLSVLYTAGFSVISALATLLMTLPNIIPEYQPMLTVGQEFSDILPDFHSDLMQLMALLSDPAFGQGLWSTVSVLVSILMSFGWAVLITPWLLVSTRALSHGN